MKHILHPRSAHLMAALAGSESLLAFDFDGTLAPIVAERERAALRPRTRGLLARLAALYPCAVISGRSLADVRARLHGTGIHHVIGNHGLESSGAALKSAATMRNARRHLVDALGNVAGIDIEDKRLSLSVHYRASRNHRRAAALIHSALARLPVAVRVMRGHMVINVLPAQGLHKGSAMQHLQRQLGTDVALFVGDDVTDEDVFEIAERSRVIGVRVGCSGSSSARYCLQEQREIDRLLTSLIDQRLGSA